MADIQRDIDQISTARYGREVRGSIVNALTLMNEESSEAIDKAVTAQDSASASAEEARDYASRFVDLAGGNTDQVLTKKSNADYDYEWRNNSPISDAYDVVYGDTNVGAKLAELDNKSGTVNEAITQINNDLSVQSADINALNENKQDRLAEGISQAIAGLSAWSPTEWKNQGGTFTIGSYGHILRLTGTFEPRKTGTKGHSDSYFLYVSFERKFYVGVCLDSQTNVTWIEK